MSKNFGCVKTIVLPVDFKMAGGGGYTLEEYKDKYGIDLKELFNISLDMDNKYINAVFPKNTAVYLSVVDDYLARYIAGPIGEIAYYSLIPVVNIATEQYESENNPAQLRFGVDDMNFTLTFNIVIQQSVDFDLSNITIEAIALNI